MWVILQEHGLVTKSNLLLQCPDFKCPDKGIRNCCCCQTLYNQPNFVEVESMLKICCRLHGICWNLKMWLHCCLWEYFYLGLVRHDSVMYISFTYLQGAVLHCPNGIYFHHSGSRASTQHWCHIPAKILLQTQFHWAVLGLCKVDLLTLPSNFKGSRSQVLSEVCLHLLSWLAWPIFNKMWITKSIGILLQIPRSKM